MLLPTWVGAVGIRSMGIAFDHSHGAELLLFILLLVWAADTGAYFAGKNLGKHKLAPKVSPKKTWEGVYGGLFLALAVMVAGIHLLQFDREQWLPLKGLTIIIVAYSVIGDLTESIFKRLTGVKDSGRILPGHGGILDRIDGVTAVLPISLLGFSILGIQ
jgi:phosphatidate cytidylyltransferase